MRVPRRPLAIRKLRLTKLQHVKQPRVHVCNPVLHSNVSPSPRIELSCCMRQITTATIAGKTFTPANKCYYQCKTAMFHCFMNNFQTPRGMVQTLWMLKPFPRPMDRAEVLHAPNYDLNGKRKIFLAKTNWFFHEKSLIFNRKCLHSLRSTCH